ncbi:glycosyltransferase [Bifidobacterium leontopitheci]|uniref:Glycosyltransferase n=1 Tax=Bifidobacterium leontopitheci TaxID=2650774 RepID=A0A6I1GPP0_9BIFI|nr:glycosyltransferase [Bifidobacterium leontopitheci]KAB7791466.1 glycosyltransferase [Bifidobacterium leontopitheci]
MTPSTTPGAAVRHASARRRRGLIAVVAVTLAILLIECVAFNMPFWSTLGASTDSASATNTMGSGLQRDKYGMLKVTDPTQAWLEVKADGTSSYARIDPVAIPEGLPESPLGNVFVRADCDGMTGASASVSASAPRSLYLKAPASHRIRLWIEEPKGSVIPFSAVRANVRVQFDFSVLRVAAMAVAVLLVALWRPGSFMWRIRLNPASARQRWLLVAALAPAAVATAVGVVWQVANASPLVFQNPSGYTYDFDQYGHVADALLHGHAWLDLPVPSELAQAAQPHDTLLRSRLLDAGVTPIYWDYAFYDGHWYSYFGVVPAVLFFLPYQAVTSLWIPGGATLPAAVAVLLSMFAFLVFACLLVVHLVHRLRPQASLAAASICIVLFLLGSESSYLWFRTNFYSVPIAASMMFTTLGLWLWIKATPDRHPGPGGHVHTGSWSVGDGVQPLSLRYLASGAACIAANFGCRPTFALSALFAFPLFWPQITAIVRGLKNRTVRVRQALRAPAAVVIPAIIVVAPLMAYNMVRFGSPLDFGNDYQMTVTDMTRFKQPLANFPQTVGAYLFMPLRFLPQFPFLGVSVTAFPEWGYYEPMVGGLFVSCPLLLLAFAAPVMKRRLKPTGYWGMVTFALALGMLLMLFDGKTAGLGWRYICDFGWMVSLGAIAVLLSVVHPRRRGLREDGEPTMMLTAVRWLVVAVTLASLLLMVLGLFVPGRDDALVRNNPALYDTVLAWFRL